MTLTAAITFTLYLGLGQTLLKYDLLCPIRTVYHPPTSLYRQKQRPREFRGQIPRAHEGGSLGLPPAPELCALGQPGLRSEAGVGVSSQLLSSLRLRNHPERRQGGWGWGTWHTKGKGRLGQRHHGSPGFQGSG